MRTTKSIVVYIVSFMLLYLGLSAIGCIFPKSNLELHTYSECIGSREWFIIYTLFIGWWVSAIIAREYYDYK